MIIEIVKMVIFLSVPLIIYALIMQRIAKKSSDEGEEHIRWKESTIFTKITNMFNGRIDRIRVVGILVYTVILFILLFVLFLMAWGATLSDDIYIYMMLMLLLLYIPLAIGVSIRRFHDLGFSGWWTILNFTPAILILLPVLIFMKGQDKVNKYGSPVPKGRHSVGLLLNTYISIQDENNMPVTKKIFTTILILYIVTTLVFVTFF